MAKDRNKKPRTGLSRRIVITLFCVLTVAGVMATGTAAGLAERDASPRPLFSLTLGSDISAYDGDGVNQELFGPIALAIASDQTVWVADGAGSKVLRFSPHGQLLATIDLSDRVVGVGDFDLIDDDRLAVLDIAAPQPTVLVIDAHTGVTLETIVLPESAGLAFGLTGIAVMQDGTIVAELQDGVYLSALDTQESQAGDSYATAAGQVRIQPRRAIAPEVGGAAVVDIGGEPVQIGVANYLGTIELVGATPSVVVLSVDELGTEAGGETVVDKTIRAYTPKGALIGVGRVPLTDFSVYVPRPVAVAPSGAVIVMVPRLDRIDFMELPLAASVPPALPVAHVRVKTVSGATSGTSGLAPDSCTSRATMRTTDLAYRLNTHYYSATNISGTCSGRKAPRYFSGAGTYDSVSYEWGGWDTVATFNAGMSPGTMKAGNINGVVLACSLGVDCSGFVTRVWQRTDKKYGTSTLSQISTPLGSFADLLEYDIMMKSTHVMLFRYFGTGGGFWVSEATTRNHYDRVVYNYIDSTYAANFAPWRYDNVCP